MTCTFNDDAAAALSKLAEEASKDFLDKVLDWPSFYTWHLKIFTTNEVSRVLVECKTCTNALNSVTKHIQLAYIKARQDTPFDVTFFGFRAVFLDLLYANIRDNLKFIKENKQ